MYDTVWYIHLLQFGFHPVAVVGRLVQKYETDRTKNTKTIKNAEYIKQKHKTKANLNRILKSLVIRK